MAFFYGMGFGLWDLRKGRHRVYIRLAVKVESNKYVPFFSLILFHFHVSM